MKPLQLVVRMDLKPATYGFQAWCQYNTQLCCLYYWLLAIDGVHVAHVLVLVCVLNQNSFLVLFQIECVGSVDSGLRCMAWSPDQELVVFMTGLNRKTLLVINYMYK